MFHFLWLRGARLASRYCFIDLDVSLCCVVAASKSATAAGASDWTVETGEDMSGGSHEAEAEIARLIARYNIAGDRGRLDELAGTFTEDGTLKTPLWEVTGRARIAERLRTSSSLGGVPLHFVRHHVTTSLISFEGPLAASGRSYFLVFTQNGMDHAGVYVDRYRRDADEWRIERREVRIDWKAAGSLFVNQPVSRSK
jgi:hypothetical protein